MAEESKGNSKEKKDTRISRGKGITATKREEQEDTRISRGNSSMAGNSKGNNKSQEGKRNSRGKGSTSFVNECVGNLDDKRKPEGGNL